MKQHGRTRSAIAVATALMLVAAACGGSTDDAEPAPASAEPASEASASTVAPSEPASTTVGESADESAPANSAQQTAPTTLVASPDADLPNVPPPVPGESSPATTIAGPLPEPSVSLTRVGTFDVPVDMTFRDLDPRTFVVEREGRVVAFDDESNLTVLDLGDVDAADVTSEGSEQGLLGLAFHPSADLAYVDFTNGDGNTVVAEFAIDPTTAEFDTGSYREVLTVEQPFANHNGGDLEFGPDGFLYIATGDGGAADDPERNALDLTSRLGKLLRIDPTASGDSEFTVPDDNPFLGSDDADPTIWSYGLRNPWKISFDSITGDLYIGDVGQGEFEEIDLAPATDGRDAGRGLSFGWSALEGNEPLNNDQTPDGHLPPIVTYSHDDGACSVSAGVVARSSSFGDLNGWYVYGDFCSGTLWALDTTSVGISDSTVVGTPVIVEIGNVASLSAVRVGPDGDIYALSTNGEMFRLAPF